jgi:hypothetical protein
MPDNKKSIKNLKVAPPVSAGPLCFVLAAYVTCDPAKYYSISSYKGLKDLQYSQIGVFEMQLWRLPDEWRVFARVLMDAVLKVVPSTKRIGILTPQYYVAAVVDPVDTKKANWCSMHEAYKDDKEQFCMRVVIQKHVKWEPPPKDDEAE